MKERILLTRNKAQNKSLARVTHSLGFDTYELPLIDIVKTSDISALKLIKEDIELFDMFIFISVHAVKSGVTILLEQKHRIKDSAKFIAVGERTAAELSQFVPSALFPDSGVGGEALMNTAEMNDLKGKRVLIVRGESGKEWLGKEIQRRSGRIDYFNCYRRRKPRFLETSFKQFFSNQLFDICFLHSSHAATNLIEAAGSLRDSMLKTDAIVGSEDIGSLLQEFGWKGLIVIADSPSNDDMLKAVALRESSLEDNKWQLD